mmetsp:Transcript_72549/g.200092  ORF Transcript_72549/g.200092 Transcript_72549/m.200092 type:complete len:238 (+) Transcript_72549:30-743(+)
MPSKMWDMWGGIQPLVMTAAGNAVEHVSCVVQEVLLFAKEQQQEPEMPCSLATVNCIGGTALAGSLVFATASNPGIWTLILGHSHWATSAMLCAAGLVGLMGFGAAQIVLVGYDEAPRRHEGSLGRRLTCVYLFAASLPPLVQFVVHSAALKYLLWLNSLGLYLACHSLTLDVEREHRHIITKACSLARRERATPLLQERRTCRAGPSSLVVVTGGGMRVCAASSAVWGAWLSMVFS